MANGAYIGVDSVARKIKKCYIGVDGVARKVKKIYIGVNGVAKLCWQAIQKRLSALTGTTTVSTISDSLSANQIHCAYKNNDNHVLVGAYTLGSSNCNSSYLYNCKLDDNGNISSFTRYEANYEQFSNWTSTLESISKFNDTYGVCVYSSRNDSSSGNDSRYLDVFNLNSSSSRVSRLLVDSGTLDRSMPIVKLNYDTILIPDYSTGGYAYGKLFKCENGTAVQKSSVTLTNILPYSSSYDVIWYDRCVAFPLSNDRFASFTTIRQEYTTENNSTTMRLLANIYSYSYNSSGNLTVTNVANHVLPYVYITNVIEMDDDYFVGISANTATGFYVDGNNNIVMSNTVSGANGFSASRIGTSDSVYGAWYDKYSIIYYNKASNTVEITSTGTRGNTSFPILPYNEQDALEVTQSGGVITFNKTEFS